MYQLYKKNECNVHNLRIIICWYTKYNYSSKIMPDLINSLPFAVPPPPILLIDILNAEKVPLFDCPSILTESIEEHP